MHVLYGSSYVQAAGVMAVLAFWLPPMFFNTIMTQVFTAAGRQSVTTAIMFGAAVVNPLLNIVLIPLAQRHYHDGAIGAAVALVITEVLHAITRWILVGRHICDRGVMRRCALIIGASAAMWIVTYLAQPLGSAISLMAGVLTLVVLIVVLRILTHDEISFARNALARVFPRLTPAWLKSPA
jgi:O-antigen/teichoic acid export membrane protein